jgi:hypothetical protein
MRVVDRAGQGGGSIFLIFRGVPGVIFLKTMAENSL